MSDATVSSEGTTTTRPSRGAIYRFTAIVLVVCVLLFVLMLRLLAAFQASSVTTGGMVGQRAPDFTLTVWNLEPSSLNLHQLQGQPVVVNFWASWCGPCQDEAPLLTHAIQTENGQVAFVGVAEQTTKTDGMQFLSQHGIPYPSGPDPKGAIATAYALPGLPVTIFINRQGIVAKRVTGQLTQATLTAGLKAITS
jgi:cytochrome c biogenesis protein CcmG, thiol:disulfide interchange protein DsbE